MTLFILPSDEKNYTITQKSVGDLARSISRYFIFFWYKKLLFSEYVRQMQNWHRLQIDQTDGKWEENTSHLSS